MSKSKLIFLLSFVALVLSFSHVSADDNTTENVTKRRPDRPEAAQVQEIRQEIRSDIASNHATRLERHFTFYYTRLSNIIVRFQKRIDILKAAGKDTTLVTTKLNAAKSKLDEAKAKGTEAVAAFKAIDPAKFSEQRTQVLAARDLSISARKLFVEAQSLLKDAVKELKTISK